jgi:hypothetical protein
MRAKGQEPCHEATVDPETNEFQFPHSDEETLSLECVCKVETRNAQQTDHHAAMRDMRFPHPDSRCGKSA